MSYILLVEDNQATADMEIRILEAGGYTVRHYERAMDAAKVARQDRPDLILMDFNLPDIDGRTMALVLKKQLGGVNAPPIVAVTARTGDQERYLAQRFGCDAFISKPFEREAFLKVVEQLMECQKVNKP
jgi:two-component system cell cycle response regulator DivK